MNPKTLEEETLPCHDALEKISIDIAFAGIKPINVIFPWLVSYDIGRTNKINTDNSNEIARVLREFLERSTDLDSVYSRVLKAGAASKEEVFADIMSFLFGGHETISRALTTAMYVIKKFPDVTSRLRKEIEEHIPLKGHSFKDLAEVLDGSTIDECEYLSNFVSEILRFSPPAGRSLGYKAKREVNMQDGTVIKKDQIVGINVFAAHQWPEEWQRPTEFLPDRFNTESPLYTRPDGGKRSPNAFCPFIFGMRQCPGKALGKMELKVLVMYFLLNTKWEIPEDLLANDDLTFTILSPHELELTMEKIAC